MSTENTEQGGDKPAPHQKSPPPGSIADVVVEKLQSFQPATLLDSIGNPRLKRVMYEFFSSLGFVSKAPEDTRPEWALQAWREFARASGMFPEAKQVASDSEQVGYSVGMASELDPKCVSESPDMSKLLALFSEVFPEIREAAAHSAPAEAAAFFNAQEQGQETLSQVLQPTQRTIIFLTIATGWQHVAGFKSTGELYNWLIAQGVIQPPGKETGKGGTDSREIRKVCEIIGLRYSRQG